MKYARLRPMVFMMLFVLLCPFLIHAQTWLGTTSTDWNDPANWQGGAVRTLFNSTAVFDGTSSNDYVISGVITIDGIDIKAAYTGTISMVTGSSIVIGTANFTQAGGTFICGDASFTCTNNSNFNCTGGVFISSSLTNFINH